MVYFIDSPPEKDVQWSDTGVASSNKFLQRIWNLGTIINKTDSNGDQEEEKNFVNNINLYAYKIDNSINNFQFNVAIAQFYEVYRYFNDSLRKKINNKILSSNLITIMKLMIPFTPHLAYECLSILKSSDIEKWPKISSKILENVKTKMVVQINGRTRDVVDLNKNLSEKEVDKLIKKSEKIKKYLENKKILKTIFVRDRIINYIIKSQLM